MLVLDHWDEIQHMFSQAMECVDILKEQGDTRQIAISVADYGRAEEAWANYDYEATFKPLDRIIGKCPESVPPALLVIVLMPLLLDRFKEKARRSSG